MVFIVSLLVVPNPFFQEVVNHLWKFELVLRVWEANSPNRTPFLDAWCQAFWSTPKYLCIYLYTICINISCSKYLYIFNKFHKLKARSYFPRINNVFHSSSIDQELVVHAEKNKSWKKIHPVRNIAININSTWSCTRWRNLISLISSKICGFMWK